MDPGKLAPPDAGLAPEPDAYAWRGNNSGRVLSDALRRFEDRVIDLMRLAGYAGTRGPHVNLTRHLDLDGTRMTELARRASMTNAAMTELIDQCELLGLVERVGDPADRRARVVRFTPYGLKWLNAFGEAIMRAERELLDSIGTRSMDVLLVRLQRYGATVDSIDKTARARFPSRQLARHTQGDS